MSLEATFVDGFDFRQLPKFDSKDLPFAVNRMCENMLGKRCDANETATFARQLEQIYVQTYDVLFPGIKWRQFFSIDGRPGPGADAWTWRQYDKKGDAKFIANWSTDFPTAEVIGFEKVQKLKSLGASYRYSMQDLRAAAFANLSLDALKARAAREAMERKVDLVMCQGDSATGLMGLANQTVQVNGGSARTATANYNGTATAAQVISDLNLARNDIFVGSKGIHDPDTWLVDVATYGWLSSTPYNSVITGGTIATDMTVMSYLLRALPWLKTIDYWGRLDTAGASSKARTVLFQNSPDIVQAVVGQDFEQFAPQQELLNFVVPCHMRIGGIDFRYPLAYQQINGVQP